MNRIKSSCPRLISLAVVFCVFVTVIAGCEWGDKTDGKTETTITLAPTASRLSASAAQSVDFVSTGGVGVLTWSVSDASLGTIYPADANATYLSVTNAGVNIITVSDADGNAASATVTQL